MNNPIIIKIGGIYKNKLDGWYKDGFFNSERFELMPRYQKYRERKTDKIVDVYFAKDDITTIVDENGVSHCQYKEYFDQDYEMVDEIEKTVDCNGERKQFATGAVRSKDADDVRYDLITPVGFRRLAETYREGAEKYGVDNWKKGMPVSECLNHAMKHIEQYRSGDNSEDHLAHAVWNLMTIMHFEEKMPEMMDIKERMDK